MKTLYTLFILMTINYTYAQNIIKIGFGGSIDSSGSFVEIFELDYNKTEAIESSTNKLFSLCSGSCNWFLQPSASINVGAGTSASSNNIISQFKFIHLNKGKTVPKGKTKYDFKKTINHQSKFDINPSWESDKNFRERLFYFQFRFNYNPIIIKKKGINKSLEEKKVTGFMINPYANIGFRNSRDFQSNNIYTIAGLHFEWFYKFKHITENDVDEKYKLSLKADGFYVLSEANHFSQIDPWRYSLSGSISKKISDNINFFISGEYGNITPKYDSFNAIKLGLTIKQL